MRNIFQFDNKLSTREKIFGEGDYFADNILHAFMQSVSIPNNNHETLIKWNFSPAGTVKVNTNGSCMGNLGPTGFGGMASDDQWQWLE